MTASATRTESAPHTMDDIAALARAYAQTRDALEETAEEIRAMQRRAVASRLRGLKSRVAETAAARDALHAAIESRPDLFEKPRTVAVDGVKFGYRKLPGKVTIPDEAEAIKLLRRKFPDRATALVKTRESLDKGGLANMAAADLAKIGVTVTEAGDEVTIKAAKADIDKLVEALLDDAGPNKTGNKAGAAA